MNKHFPGSSMLTIEDFKSVKDNIDNPEYFDGETIMGFVVEDNFTLGFSVSDQLAKADLFIKVISKSKNKVEAIGEFHLVFIYSVENFNDFVKENEENELIVNEDLFKAISEISYSTTRGVLLAKVQGTSLQSFILPIADSMKEAH